MIGKLGLIALLLCGFSIAVGAQQGSLRWQRVYTGDDSVIELNGSSLKFEPDNVLRATYRTVLSKPESLAEKTGAKYKSRVETVVFASSGRRYRFDEVSWLDVDGNLVHTYHAAANAEWKVFKEGGIINRMFSAIVTSAPFGAWKVLAYRFGDGPANETIAAPEPARLVNTHVRLNLDRAEVGGKVCSAPTYLSRRFTAEEFSRDLGVELKGLGITSNHAESIIVKCAGKDWQPPQSLLIQLPEGGMLILWEGVFLTLGHREHFENKPAYTLRQRAPTP